MLENLNCTPVGIKIHAKLNFKSKKEPYWPKEEFSFVVMY